MLLGIIFITKTLHKRTQSIQKTSVKEIQQFSNNEKVNFCSFELEVGNFSPRLSVNNCTVAARTRRLNLRLLAGAAVWWAVRSVQ